MIVTVTLSRAPRPGRPSWCRGASPDGTATAGSDYTAATGTLTFGVGDDTLTVTVVVNGDTVVEPDEYLSLVLGDPTGATLGTGTARIVLTNDDVAAPALPTVSIGDASVIEGRSGTRWSS